MDFSLQQSIISVEASTVATAVASIHAKYKSKMLSLQKKIKNSLFLRDFRFGTPLLDPDAPPKTHLNANSLPKATTKRWNQADLGYFDPYLNRAHGEGEIVLVKKDVYYRNVVLFVQRLQSFVTF